MERRKSEELGNVLLRYMRETGLESPLNEYRLIEAWIQKKSPPVGAYTEKAYIRNQTLFVKLKSAGLRANLLMQRKLLVKELNSAVGANVIVDIIFL